MREFPPFPLALAGPIDIPKNILGSIVNDGYDAE
jgi:hypothetical protein